MITVIFKKGRFRNAAFVSSGQTAAGLSVLSGLSLYFPVGFV